MKTMNEVLMDRDNMSRTEANTEVENARSELYDILENDGTYEDVEDMMMCDYGLEMDYIFDLLV